VDGGQAEYVRVPNADIVLSRRPPYVSEEAALFVGDTLTTALTAVERAGVRPGHVVAVVGAGPVGLLSGFCAQVAGAALVFVSDPAPARRTLAQKLGLTAVSPDQLDEAVRVDGDGADAVIEAVGSYPALAAAVNAAGRRATVAVAGAHHGAGGPFPAGHAFAQEATVTFVVGNPIRTRDETVALLRSGRLDPTVLVSHRLPLSEAARAYELFDQGVASKVVLEVGV
jgi:threonine dehydrogenase-like Zn-dependent dehydrogenase